MEAKHKIKKQKFHVCAYNLEYCDWEDPINVLVESEHQIMDHPKVKKLFEHYERECWEIQIKKGHCDI